MFFRIISTVTKSLWRPQRLLWNTIWWLLISY